ncbi:MAG: hypothetical protein H0U78_00310 [Rickettsiaceae bacterium]|nr:hypothetical protein [Rickettsiaceae bacterium]
MILLKVPDVGKARTYKFSIIELGIKGYKLVYTMPSPFGMFVNCSKIEEWWA